MARHQADPESAEGELKLARNSGARDEMIHSAELAIAGAWVTHAQEAFEDRDAVAVRAAADRALAMGSGDDQVRTLIAEIQCLQSRLCQEAGDDKEAVAALWLALSNDVAVVIKTLRLPEFAEMKDDLLAFCESQRLDALAREDLKEAQRIEFVVSKLTLPPVVVSGFPVPPGGYLHTLPEGGVPPSSASLPPFFSTIGSGASGVILPDGDPVEVERR
jgi:hypothetical protein